MDGDREEMLLCPVRAEESIVAPKCSLLLFPLESGEKVFQKTILLWLQAISNEAYRCSNENECRAVKAKAHKIEDMCYSGRTI